MICLLLSLFSILSVTIALPLRTNYNVPKGVVVFETFQKFRNIDDEIRMMAIAKRDDTKFNGSIDVKNYLSFYTVDFHAGTPLQPVTAVLDTGSSDMWFYDKISGRRPFFDSSASSTYVKKDSSLYISYGSGPVRGNWGTDTIRFGNVKLENTMFGLVTNDLLRGAAIPGILGLGRISNEARTEKYDNLPARLYKEGHINRMAYSVYLNNLNSGVGNVLFGGVDSARYIEPLYEIPMANDSHLAVELTGVATRSKEGKIDFIPASSARFALLDTGTSFTYLPDAVYSQIYRRLNATYSNEFGISFVQNITDDTPDLVFNIKGIRITVSASEYVLPVKLFTTQPTPAPYILSIFRSSDIRGMTILGANFMRSAYTVFDITGNKVALAQARHDVYNVSSIKPIVDGIPGAISPHIYQPNYNGSRQRAVSGSGFYPFESLPRRSNILGSLQNLLW